MEYDLSYLISFSPTHSSHIIGETIVRGLFTDHTFEIDLTYEKPQKPVIIKEGITVIAVPVYGGRVAETAMERLEMIRGEGGPAIPVVVFGNRDYEDALMELKDWCVVHGFVPIAGGAFIGEHSYCSEKYPIAALRPDAHDLKIALGFGERLRKCLQRMDTLDKMKYLRVKGHFPYRVKPPKTPQTPVTLSEVCKQCGFCIEICPVQAIRLEDGIISDAQTCIKCCACVKQCPNGARFFDTPYAAMLYKNNSTPREPELFYGEQ